MAEKKQVAPAAKDMEVTEDFRHGATLHKKGKVYSFSVAAQTKYADKLKEAKK